MEPGYEAARVNQAISSSPDSHWHQHKLAITKSALISAFLSYYARSISSVRFGAVGPSKESALRVRAQWPRTCSGSLLASKLLSAAAKSVRPGSPCIPLSLICLYSEVASQAQFKTAARLLAGFGSLASVTSGSRCQQKSEQNSVDTSEQAPCKHASGRWPELLFAAAERFTQPSAQQQPSDARCMACLHEITLLPLYVVLTVGKSAQECAAVATCSQMCMLQPQSVLLSRHEAGSHGLAVQLQASLAP